MRISDGSSDVCSSDLRASRFLDPEGGAAEETRSAAAACLVGLGGAPEKQDADGEQVVHARDAVVARLQEALQRPLSEEGDQQHDAQAEIGRASCRERVCQYV